MKSIEINGKILWPIKELCEKSESDEIYFGRNFKHINDFSAILPNEILKKEKS